MYEVASMPPMVNANHEVVYGVDGRKIVFSGIRTGVRTSTINAAEDIIRAICRQESISHKQYLFFDLLTHTGYESRELKPGCYKIAQLRITCNSGNVSVEQWMWGRCSPAVENAFDRFIGKTESGSKKNVMHTPGEDGIEMRFLL